MFTIIFISSIHFINFFIFFITFFTIGWMKICQINFIDCFTILIFTYPFIFFDLIWRLNFLRLLNMNTLNSFLRSLIFNLIINIELLFPILQLLLEINFIKKKYLYIFNIFYIISANFIFAFSTLLQNIY
jgi:hypothetical protein